MLLGELLPPIFLSMEAFEKLMLRIRNIYYGTIYAYTPEILPSAHRATGYGLCVVANRIGGIFGVLVGGYANVETTAPLFICASLSGLLVILSLLLPFESRGKRTQ